MKQVEGQIKEEGKIDLYVADQNITILFDTNEEYITYMQEHYPSAPSTEQVNLITWKQDLEARYEAWKIQGILFDNEYDQLFRALQDNTNQ